MGFVSLLLVAFVAAANFGWSSAAYTCPFSNTGKRIHETASATIYDCRDYNCGNTCQGGQCVALVTCTCTSSAGNHPPGTNCWRRGTSLKTATGTCNSAVPVGTAIATFDSNGNYYAGHAAVFAGCVNSNTIQVLDQWCCRSVGYTNYASSHSYFSTFAVIENTACADRTSWSCRTENAGSTCCPTWVEGCSAHKYWWTPFSGDADADVQPVQPDA